MPSIRVLYLHGFASGPESAKGRAMAAALAPHGVRVERLNLRVPSLERLRVTAMIAQVREAMGTDRCVLIGSSLGGEVAARVAETDSGVVALGLLAPAFSLPGHWAAVRGAELDDWRETGWLGVTDHTTGRLARVDYGFFEDLCQVSTRPVRSRVPTLVLHGRRDEVVPIDHSRTWAASQPAVHLLEVEDDHELLAHIDVVTAEMVRFLRPWLPTPASANG